MEISEKEIEAIVRSVLSGLAQKDFQAGALHVNDRTCSNGQDGIFEQVEDAIEAARTAQKEWIHRYKLEDRKRIIEAIRAASRAHAESLARMVHEETGMGRYEDKIIKHMAVKMNKILNVLGSKISNIFFSFPAGSACCA